MWNFCFIRFWGNSLEAQWLVFHAFTARAWVQAWGNINRMPQAECQNKNNSITQFLLDSIHTH